MRQHENRSSYIWRSNVSVPVGMCACLFLAFLTRCTDAAKLTLYPYSVMPHYTNVDHWHEQPEAAWMSVFVQLVVVHCSLVSYTTSRIRFEIAQVSKKSVSCRWWCCDARLLEHFIFHIPNTAHIRVSVSVNLALLCHSGQAATQMQPGAMRTACKCL